MKAGIPNYEGQMVSTSTQRAANYSVLQTGVKITEKWRGLQMFPLQLSNGYSADLARNPQKSIK
jgi:hypothetical protein